MSAASAHADYAGTTDIRALIERVDSSDREARLEATRAFISIGPIGAYSKTAVTHLVALVATDDDEVRMAAISAMERIGSQANLAVPALIAALATTACMWSGVETTTASMSVCRNLRSSTVLTGKFF